MSNRLEWRHYVKEKIGIKAHILTDIIANTSREDNDAYSGVKELELGKNTTENRERRNGECDAGEKHKVGEFDAFVDELVVDRDCQTCSHTKW